MFALADCNNFFVSCEKLFKPSLEGKPVVVLSNNDGCVVSRSNEAKAIGIPMGMPAFQLGDYVKDCSKVIMLSGNLNLYTDISKRVHHTMQEMIPLMEIYSIDEAFLDMSEFEPQKLETIGREMVRRIRQYTGIPVSIGIAPSKTLAKVASKYAKKHPECKGCFVLNNPDEYKRLLSVLNVEDVWGIGRRHSTRLHALGIHTAQDFVRAPMEWVHKNMSITGLRTWKELQGTACYRLEDKVADKQSICVSRSFRKEITTLDLLGNQIASFTTATARELREQKSVCQQILVFVRANRFTPGSRYANDQMITVLDSPTDDSIVLVNCAIDSLRRMFKDGAAYKQAGVVLHSIIPKANAQYSLFEPGNREKHQRLMEALDSIYNSQGPDAIRFGAEGSGKKAYSKQSVSPRYTTCWDELPICTIK